MPQTGFDPDAEAVVLLTDHSFAIATLVSGSEGESGYRTPRGTEPVGPADSNPFGFESFFRFDDLFFSALDP